MGIWKDEIVNAPRRIRLFLTRPTKNKWDFWGKALTVVTILAFLLAGVVLILRG